MRWLISLLGVALLTWHMLAETGALPVQANHCDADLLKIAPKDNPYRYELRGDRCEGVFTQPRSAGLRLLQFTVGPDTLREASNGQLLVAWPAAEIPVRLTAVADSADVFYRMDTIRPAKEGAFGWPARMAKQLGLAVDQLVVSASYEQRIDGRNEKVFLPLRVNPAASVQGGDYGIVLLPELVLDTLKYDLYRVDEGRVSKSIIESGSWVNGYAPADRVLRRRLNLPRSGVYYLEATGKARVPQPVFASFYLARL